jgi:hypothetical protein
MHEQLQQCWDQLSGSVSVTQSMSAFSLAVYLLIGGLLAMYIRLVYHRCGSSPSDQDSITRVFPLLTLVTIGVIAVVKSSLALSLGLVGALSIVRFRAAIKEPEELVYLFLCIGVGLALGAGLPLMAIVLVVVATVFIAVQYLVNRGRRQQSILLTVTGDVEPHFDDQHGVLAAIDELAGRYSLQRLDLENGRGQMRVILKHMAPHDTAALVTRLRDRLPDCEFSYVNMTSTM